MNAILNIFLASATLVKYLVKLDLAPYIRELVLLNECVILPGFGGFETSYSAARYDNFKRQMLPPTKKVHFRQDYIKGGGVLESHLCERLHINEEQAKVLIDEYIKDIQSRLEQSNEAMVAGMGLFTKGLGGMLNFTPFEEENYLADSFGLDALPFEQAEDEQGESITQELEIRPRSNTLQFVLVGFGLISILLILTVFISSRFDLYLFNIGDSDVSNDLIIIGNNTNDTLYKQIDSTITESTDLKMALQYSENTSETQSPPEESKYYLIAGSFKTLKNAENTRKILVNEGYMPSIIENQGFYRVTIGSYTNKQEALKELQRLRRQLDRSIWLLQV